MSNKNPSDIAINPGELAPTKLIVRTQVPTGLKYAEYRPYLRSDFLYSCAYCTMSEAEAQAIRMVVDHYEPRKARPELEHDYDNLMYSCEECNLRKGDRCPPQKARDDGYRFFRPDLDSYSEHFEKSGRQLKHRTKVGWYSIRALDLNRYSLRKLRELRERLYDCERMVFEGVRGLRQFQLDRLPPKIRGVAVRAITETFAMQLDLERQIDELLSEHACSPMIGTTVQSQGNTTFDSNGRLAELREVEALYSGAWRAPRSSDK